MMYRFTNRITKTHPKIIHYPGPKTRKDWIQNWNKVCNYFCRKKYDAKMPKNISVVTFNNNYQKSLLELNLQALNIKHHVLGKSICDWNNRNKISLLNDFIDNVKTEFIMVLDSYDVIITGSMENILDDFDSFKSMVVFNATYGTYPEDDKGLYCTKEKSIKPNEVFCHLNSGCFLGKKQYIKHLYNLVKKNEDEITMKYQQSDQIKIKKFYVERCPEIQIDSQCKIFQVLGWNYIDIRPKMI